MYFAYILFSNSIEKYYTGQCADLGERLRRHNTGETVSIRAGIPWRIIWSQACETRGEAMKLEKKIKSRGASRFLADLGTA